jgi:hypothetical protein
MSYKLNFLNKNPIFQEIIDQELENIQVYIPKKILKLDSVVKKVEVKLTENQELSISVLNKDDRFFTIKIKNDYSVTLSKEEIAAYFPEEKTKALNLEEDFNIDFLEAKEPLLLEQLKIMALLKDETLLDKVIEQVRENLKNR